MGARRTAARRLATSARVRNKAMAPIRNNPLFYGGKFAGGGPLGGTLGRDFMHGSTSAMSTFRHIHAQNAIRAVRMGTPPKPPSFFARHGKATAAAVVGGAALFYGRNYTGRGVDKSRGRPTGMYRY